ncbi:MAG: hypothetical protein ACG0KC_00570 [Enterobacteriaceae bacterium]
MNLINIINVLKRKVHKFGGMTLSNSFSFKKVVNIIKNKCKNGDIIVVSAFGNVTNLLFKLVKYYKKNIKLFDYTKIKLVNYYNELISKLFNGNDLNSLKLMFLEELNFAIKILEKTKNKKLINNIISLGELWTAKILNNLLLINNLRTLFIDSRKFLISSFDTYPKIYEILSKSLLYPLIVNNKYIERFIITGYISRDIFGNTVLLGRNGSDYSAVGIASILDIKNVIIWKNVSGISNIDPKIIKGSKTLKNISITEANELSKLSSSILHFRTLESILFKNKNINIEIKYFFNSYKKTCIKKENVKCKKNIKIITIEKKVTMITVKNYKNKIIRKNLIIIFRKYDVPFFIKLIKQDKKNISIFCKFNISLELIKDLNNKRIKIKNKKNMSCISLIGDKIANNENNYKIINNILKEKIIFLINSKSSNSILIFIKKNYINKILLKLYKKIFNNKCI